MNRAYRVLNNRLLAIERKGAKISALTEYDRWYQFVTRPSCPPDTSVHISKGIVTLSAQWAAFIEQDYLPAITCDFTDTLFTGMDLIFESPNQYLGVILCYSQYYLQYWIYGEEYDDTAFDNVIGGGGVETSNEAEAQIDGFLNGVDDWYNARLPLHGVVLRNDGRINIPGAVLPVDLVNRGRSYLYRDSRALRGALP